MCRHLYEENWQAVPSRHGSVLISCLPNNPSSLCPQGWLAPGSLLAGWQCGVQDVRLPPSLRLLPLLHGAYCGQPGQVRKVLFLPSFFLSSTCSSAILLSEQMDAKPQKRLVIAGTVMWRCCLSKSLYLFFVCASCSKYCWEQKSWRNQRSQEWGTGKKPVQGHFHCPSKDIQGVASWTDRQTDRQANKLTTWLSEMHFTSSNSKVKGETEKTHREETSRHQVTAYGFGNESRACDWQFGLLGEYTHSSSSKEE